MDTTEMSSGKPVESLPKTFSRATLYRPGPTLSGRNEILVAASSVLTEKGFTATSIDEIADRLGATKGRIYHYYRSKADLFLDLQRWALEQCLDRIRPIAQDKTERPSERLFKMAYEHATMIASGLGFQISALLGRESGMLNISTKRQREALRYIIKLRDEYEDLFASAIEDGIAAGEFENMRPRLLTKPVFGALNWLLVWFHSDQPGPHASFEEIATMLATFVVNGLRARGPSLSAHRIPNATHALLR
jgi:AcrR family transcriptional regulator